MKKEKFLYLLKILLVTLYKYNREQKYKDGFCEIVDNIFDELSIKERDYFVNIILSANNRPILEGRYSYFMEQLYTDKKSSFHPLNYVAYESFIFDEWYKPRIEDVKLVMRWINIYPDNEIDSEKFVEFCKSKKN